MRFTLVIILLVLLAACEPSGQRPGLGLSGEPSPFVDDWSFTEKHREIAIQINTPYLIPHSVTIWCGSFKGDLYVAAGAPDTKRWPSWVDKDPNVKLKIGDKLYLAHLQALHDESLIREVQKVYARKYKLPEPSPTDRPSSRYWRVKGGSQPSASNP